MTNATLFLFTTTNTKDIGNTRIIQANAKLSEQNKAQSRAFAKYIVGGHTGVQLLQYLI